MAQSFISVGTGLFSVPPNFPLIGQTEAKFNKSVQTFEQMKENHKWSIRAWISSVQEVFELAPVHPHPAVTPRCTFTRTLQFGSPTTRLLLIKSSHLPLTLAHCYTWKLTPYPPKKQFSLHHVVILGEENGKICAPGSRGWDSFSKFPQLVQLQSVVKFHLDFHCLPHSLPHYICNCLREAHH